jgi:hypothetical protein
MEWIRDYFDETDNNHRSGDAKLELRRAGDAACAASRRKQHSVLEGHASVQIAVVANIA